MARFLWLAPFALLIGCAGKPSVDGTWMGDTGKQGFAIEMKMAGGKVDIDLASHTTTAKFKSEGTYQVDGETITTTLTKITLDESSLSGYMKELATNKELKEATLEQAKSLLSKLLSGAYKVEGPTLKILGNPETVTFNRK